MDGLPQQMLDKYLLFNVKLSSGEMELNYSS